MGKYSAVWITLEKISTLMIIVFLGFSVFSILAPQVKGQVAKVGYWRFNEGSGTTAVDSSGNSNTGALINSPLWVNGKYGKALSFDGVSSYVRVEDSNSLHLSTAVTLMVWIYLPTGATYGDSNIIAKQASNGGTNLGLGIHDDSGHIVFGVGLDGGYTATQQYSTNGVPRDTWTHVAATYDGSLMKMYINGVLDSSFSWTSGFSSNTNPLTIGSKNPPYVESFIKATIDEVKIFNGALSQQQVQAEMSGPPAVATLTLAPNTGFASTTLVGSGFSPNAEVSITWDGTKMSTVPNSLLTDANGNFTALVSVMTQNAPGSHTLVATDELGSQASATFTVVDMTGPQGPLGAAETSILILAFASGLSIVAICLAIVALLRKRT